MACPRRPHSAGPQVRRIEVCLFGNGVARSTGSNGPPPMDEASLRLDAGRLDHPRVFLDFAPHEYLEFLRRHVHGVVAQRSEEHTSELQSRLHLVCRLLLEKKKK